MPPNIKSTPLLEKYRTLKGKLPRGVIVLVRMGDFYESFDDDAEAVAKALNLTVTRRNGLVMTGIPYHAFSRWADKLKQMGHALEVIE